MQENNDQEKQYVWVPKEKSTDFLLAVVVQKNEGQLFVQFIDTGKVIEIDQKECYPVNPPNISFSQNDKSAVENVDVKPIIKKERADVNDFDLKLLLRGIFQKCAKNLTHLEFTACFYFYYGSAKCCGVNMEKVDVPFFFKMVPNLRRLDLCKVMVDGFWLQQLAQYVPNLVAVSLRNCIVERKQIYNPIHIELKFFLDGLKKLKFLDIAVTDGNRVCSNQKVLEADLSGSFEWLPSHLEFLDYTNKYNTLDREALQNIVTRCPKLKGLGIGFLKDHDREEDLSLLKNFTERFVLYMKDTMIDALTENCSNLEYLHLYKFQMENVFLNSLKKFGKLHKLKILNFSSDIINDEVLDEITKGTSQLERLVLGSNTLITVNGICAVLKNCKKLVELNISWCKGITKNNISQIDLFYTSLCKDEPQILRNETLKVSYHMSERVQLLGGEQWRWEQRKDRLKQLITGWDVHLETIRKQFQDRFCEETAAEEKVIKG